MTTALKNISTSYSQWLQEDSTRCVDKLKNEQMQWSLSGPRTNQYDALGYPFPHQLEKIAPPIFRKLSSAYDYFSEEKNGSVKRALCLVQVPTMINLFETAVFLTLNALRMIRYVLLAVYRLVLFIFGGFLLKQAREALYLSLESFVKDLANQISIVILRASLLIENIILSMYRIFKDDGRGNFDCLVTMTLYQNGIRKIQRLYNYKYKPQKPVE